MGEVEKEEGGYYAAFAGRDLDFCGHWPAAMGAEGMIEGREETRTEEEAHLLGESEFGKGVRGEMGIGSIYFS